MAESFFLIVAAAELLRLTLEWSGVDASDSTAEECCDFSDDDCPLINSVEEFVPLLMFLYSLSFLSEGDFDNSLELSIRYFSKFTTLGAAYALPIVGCLCSGDTPQLSAPYISALTVLALVGFTVLFGFDEGNWLSCSASSSESTSSTKYEYLDLVG